MHIPALQSLIQTHLTSWTDLSKSLEQVTSRTSQGNAKSQAHTLIEDLTLNDTQYDTLIV